MLRVRHDGAMKPSHSRPLPSGAVVHTWLPDGRPRANLVLQHGFVEYAARYFRDYSELGRHLLDRGIAVHGIDMPGHGSAKGPRGRADLRLAVSDHVRVRSEVAAEGLPVLLLGHSLGGLVTAGSLAREPRGIRTAVVMSPALVGPVPAPVRGLLRGVSRRAPGLPAPTRKAPRENLTSRADVLALADADPLLPQDLRLPMVVASSVLDVTAEVFARAGDWQAPTLFVHGTIDRWTNPRVSRALVERIDRDDVVRVEVEGGRHELLHDQDAEQTLALVLGWIDDHLSD